MDKILSPYFTYVTPTSNDQFDDATNPDREEFQFYDCVAQCNINTVKKGDTFSWISLNILTKEIHGYREIDDSDSDKEMFCFTFDIVIRPTAHSLTNN